MASSALIFALGTFVLWGTTNFLIRYGEEKTGIKPIEFTAVMWVSMGILGVILVAYLYLTGNGFKLNKDLVFPVAAGLLLGIGILSFSYALSHTDTEAGVTAAVATCNAVFTTVLAFVFLQEKLDPKQWIGIATVIIGIIILRV
jgi:drug/metabolite transporter (DMT)-like permease